MYIELYHVRLLHYNIKKLNKKQYIVKRFDWLRSRIKRKHFKLAPRKNTATAMSLKGHH